MYGASKDFLFIKFFVQIKELKLFEASKKNEVKNS